MSGLFLISSLFVLSAIVVLLALWFGPTPHYAIRDSSPRLVLPPSIDDLVDDAIPHPVDTDSRV